MLVLLLLLLPSLVQAQVVINEVAWMGTPVEGVDPGQEWRYEWFELFNAGEEAVSLDAWSLELAREETEFVVPLSGPLALGEYRVWGASLLIEGVDVSYDNLGGKFVNGGMKLTLKSGSGVEEELDFRDGYPAGSNRDKVTMELRGTEWGDSVFVGGTPGAENSVPSEEPAFGEPKRPGQGANVWLYAAATAAALGSVLAVFALRSRLS